MKAGRASHKRTGFTLIELSVAIAVSGVLLVLLASLLTVIMKADRGMRESLAENQTLERLAAQFREDVKRSWEANPRAGDAPGLELVLGPNHRVTYSTVEGHLRREEHRAEQLVRQEDYRALAAPKVRYEVDAGQAAGGARFVRMALDRPALRPEGPTTTLELVAPLGLQRRFASSSAKEATK
jgi:prepilin-type N-terminal cleavage/methylation domain-containing protein